MQAMRQRDRDQEGEQPDRPGARGRHQQAEHAGAERGQGQRDPQASARQAVVGPADQRVGDGVNDARSEQHRTDQRERESHALRVQARHVNVDRQGGKGQRQIEALALA